MIPVRGGGDYMDSILTSVKKSLGITEEYEHFDVDIIMHINTVFSTLTQIGAGPDGGFRIEDKTMSWSEYLPDDRYDLESIKTYMCLRVRMLFDPPASSTITESIGRNIDELEWRIKTAFEDT